MTDIPTDDQIHAMDGTALTTLAFALGLAPRGVAPSAADPCYYYDARGFPWVPALDIVQARAVFFDRLEALDFDVVRGRRMASRDEQALGRRVGMAKVDSPSGWTVAMEFWGLRSDANTSEALALLRAACRAIVAQRREEVAICTL